MRELQIRVFSENYPERHFISIANAVDGPLLFEDISIPDSIPISGEARLILNEDQIGDLIAKFTSESFHDRFAIQIIGRMARLKRGHNSVRLEWRDVTSLESPAVLSINFERHQGHDYRTLNHVFLAGVDGIEIAVQITDNTWHDHNHDQGDFQRVAERKYNVSPSMVIVVAENDFLDFEPLFRNPHPRRSELLTSI